MIIEFCFLAKEEGECDESQLQWYYDRLDGVCKQFIFRGCGGNQNRFATRQECESRCSQSQDVCILPRVVGPCSGSFRQWYYDAGTDSCYEFDYGGCQGNPNRFNSAHECQSRCARVKPTLTEAPPVVHHASEQDREPERDYDREREEYEERVRERQREIERQRQENNQNDGILLVHFIKYFITNIVSYRYLFVGSQAWPMQSEYSSLVFQQRDKSLRGV